MILALPQEVRCIWRRKFGTVTVLYTLIRYGTLINMVVNTLDAFYVLRDVPVSCLHIVIILLKVNR